MIYNFLSLNFQQPPMIEERCHFKLLTKQIFSKFHFYMPLETRGQSLLLALKLATAPCTSASIPVTGNSAGTLSFKANPFEQYLNITYLAGEQGFEPQ